MTEECTYIIKFLNCEYEYFEHVQDYALIMEAYERMTEQSAQEGYTPLIIVIDMVLAETLEAVIEEAEDESADTIAALRQQTIAKAGKINVGELLEQRWNDSVSDEEAGGEFDLWGNFTAAVPNHQLYIHPYQTAPYPEIIIAKIPTTSAWELAAWVPMGGFNSCPFPEEQAAVFSHWYQKYGAIPAVVTHDTWEMKLTRPPVDDITAEALAKEQFAFCSDIVYQAAGSTASIRGLASHLKDSTSWYFWWD